jgi:energy-converting hydrogenase A subunit M
LEASKTESCKELSLDVDHVLNALASHFNKSSKRKLALQALQDELNDAQKTLKRYHKICWLSRFQVVTTLCDC